MPGKHQLGNLGIAGNYVPKKKSIPAPPTPKEAIEALKASPFYCEACRTHFLTKASLEAHKACSHLPYKKSRRYQFTPEKEE